MVEVATSLAPVCFIATTPQEYQALRGITEVTYFATKKFKIEVTKTLNICICGITIILCGLHGVHLTLPSIRLMLKIIE